MYSLRGTDKGKWKRVVPHLPEAAGFFVVDSFRKGSRPFLNWRLCSNRR